MNSQASACGHNAGLQCFTLSTAYTTEQIYDFAIKVTSDGTGVTWPDVSGVYMMKLTVACGPLSTTVAESTFYTGLAAK